LLVILVLDERVQQTGDLGQLADNRRMALHKVQYFPLSKKLYLSLFQLVHGTSNPREMLQNGINSIRKLPNLRGYSLIVLMGQQECCVVGLHHRDQFLKHLVCFSLQNRRLQLYLLQIALEKLLEIRLGNLHRHIWKQLDQCRHEIENCGASNGSGAVWQLWLNFKPESLAQMTQMTPELTENVWQTQQELTKDSFYRDELIDQVLHMQATLQKSIASANAAQQEHRKQVQDNRTLKEYVSNLLLCTKKQTR
jgi:hypothetical protein